MRRLPYLIQQTDFTCGPACLLFVLKFLRPRVRVHPEEEFLIWRAANTVYMVEGHPGCGPYGLALEAARRGLKAVVYTYQLAEAFAFWNQHNQSFAEMAVMMNNLDYEQACTQGLSLYLKPYTLQDLKRNLADKQVVMLLDTSQISGHWVVIYGYGKQGWLVHDPLLAEGEESPFKIWTDQQVTKAMTCPHTGAQSKIVFGR